MPRVRNVVTGLEWEVPPGHFSLSDAEYEVLPDAEPTATPALTAAPEPEPKKPNKKK